MFVYMSDIYISDKLNPMEKITPNKVKNNKTKFNSIKIMTAAERIVKQILDQIASGELKRGDKLPSEKMLAEQFRASRPSVREAIHTLKTIGLIVVRQGDGAYITRIDDRALANYFLILNSIGEFTLAEVNEARLLLEPIIVELAAQRAEESDLIEIEKKLMETKSRIETKENPTSKNIAFHRVIANSCKNSLLALILNSVLNVLVANISKVSSNHETNEAAYFSHERIFRALRDKDAAKAVKCIKEDLQVLDSNLQRTMVGKS
jgi:GntR family transcriptional regulator, transcriptional repressor for pyruvate dehydrogenase complex